MSEWWRSAVANLWERLDARITWLALAQLRASFFSKAVTALSLAALVLGQFGPQLADLPLDLGSLRRMFLGALLFVAGYLTFGLLAPPEFRRATEVDEIVRRMTVLHDRGFFQSRLRVAEASLRAVEARGPLGPPRHALDFVRMRLAEAATAGDRWPEHAPGLYHADLTLRQHARPALRLLVAALLGAGALLLLLPTLRNVALALGLL